MTTRPTGGHDFLQKMVKGATLLCQVEGETPAQLHAWKSEVKYILISLIIG